MVCASQTRVPRPALRSLRLAWAMQMIGASPLGPERRRGARPWENPFDLKPNARQRFSIRVDSRDSRAKKLAESSAQSTSGFAEESRPDAIQIGRQQIAGPLALRSHVVDTVPRPALRSQGSLRLTWAKQRIGASLLGQERRRVARPWDNPFDLKPNARQRFSIRVDSRAKNCLSRVRNPRVGSPRNRGQAQFKSDANKSPDRWPFRRVLWARYPGRHSARRARCDWPGLSKGSELRPSDTAIAAEAAIA